MVKNIIIITGANKGFGRACALASKSAYPCEDLVVALVGRNQSELENVAAEMKPLHTWVYSKFDCTNYNSNNMKSFIQDLIDRSEGSANFTIIHNAGSVGDPSKSATDLSSDDVTNYMTLNLSSAVALNNDFLSLSGSAASKTVVNISSIVAIQPCTSLSLYCTGKAARNMYFQVVAAENKDIRVLNYCPGPLDTAMFHTVRQQSCFNDTKTVFGETIPLTPQESAEKLMRILKEDKFQSGAAIDFFDYE